MRLIIWIQTLVFIAAFSEIAYTHGMVYDIQKKEAVIIIAEYDDGEPMYYADVKIYSPSEPNIEYQNGRTDKNGRFAFLPDSPGDWQITVDGGMGHVIKTSFTFEGNEIKTEKIKRAFPKWMGIIAGLGFIFGITGLIKLFQRKKMI